MERTALRSLTFCVLLAAAAPLLAAADDCVIPVPPRMPDASTASQEQMLETQQQVHGYLAATRAYLACFRRQEVKWASRMTPSRRQLLDQLWNTQVGRMHRTANHFNVVLAEWRMAHGEVVATR